MKSSEWLNESTITEMPIEANPDDPMNPTIYNKGAVMDLKSRMRRATSELKDLASMAEMASKPGMEHEWRKIVRLVNDELALNLGEITHALDELAARRKKGGANSRGISQNI